MKITFGESGTGWPGEERGEERKRVVGGATGERERERDECFLLFLLSLRYNFLSLFNILLLLILFMLLFVLFTTTTNTTTTSTTITTTT